ncbi:molybdopterin molybdotransferase MoeA [Halosimplex salinum]|uniref:molybdopterin molybdotransferase MoeA n=1 Tax=Halosimplex salinum TaxID=1710538 RepID=UPI000F47F3AE|nr:molybdopterin molybdotransferase MoeA [Halosimplex salinum]
MDEPRRSAADRTPLGSARDRLREAVAPVDRTETLPVSTAVGRPLADPVVARRPVPHYDQVVRDGFALRAADTTDASDAAAVTFAVAEALDAPASPDADQGGTDTDQQRADSDRPAAVRVHAGDELPGGADAVVGREADSAAEDDLETVTETDGELSVTRPVEPGSGVRPTGADVGADETVLPAGHQLTASDPALCTAVGRTRVDVRQRPTVGIVPTGGGLVGGDPDPGEVVETDGTTVAEFVERWGGKVTYRDPVPTDRNALRAAVERDLTKDLLVTVGGTGSGERDRIVDVVENLGDVLVDGVALEPGGTAALSVVRERPILSLPGDPVAAFVATTQLVGDAVTRLAGRDPPAPVTESADLAAPLDGTAGVASVVPVAFEDTANGANATDATERAVRPVADEPLSTLSRADGWVTVPSDRDTVLTGETVSVERWEAFV